MNRNRKNKFNRSLRAEYISNLIPFYQSSYKKFRYWFTIYYLMSIILTLTITINLEDWNLVSSYGEIQKYNNLIDFVDFLTESNNSPFEKDIKISEINYKVFDYIFEYPAMSNPFIYVRDQEGKYLRKKREFFNSLIDQKLIKDQNIIDSIQVYFDQDSSIIMNHLKKYNEEFERKTANKSKSERTKIAEALRKKLIKDINFELDKLLPNNLYNVVLNHESFKNVIDNSQILNQSYLVFKSDYRKKMKRLNELKSEKVGNFPYFDIKITLQIILIILILFYIFFPLILQLFYINYRIYEKEIIKFKYPMLRTPSFKNILQNVGFSNTLLSVFYSCCSLIFLLLIPYSISLYIFVWLFSVNSIFILCFIIYIIILIIIFSRKRDDMHLIAFHFK
ncbi:MAG: hypothetical protein GF353_22505 [Candidatus Lokiarchaeota archaeon]|nr:hypothetical protein [Candidatus Lokiarchaeota archaeon]